MTELLSILVVVNDPDDQLFLTTILDKLEKKGTHPRITVAPTLNQALKILSDNQFDIIIADLNLPDSQGRNTFLELQKRVDTAPIVLVGGSSEDEVAREAIRLGAQDYLPKSNLNVDLLLRIIHHAIERHRVHANLKSLSFTDELTGLYNRRGFIALLTQQLALAIRMKKGFYLFIIDLDYLKNINDTYGHLAGDKALVDIAKCIRSSFRRHDLLGRIGGDEFAIVAIDSAYESGEHLKTCLQEKVAEYNSQLSDPYQLSISIGKAYFDGLQESNLDELVLKADKELYEEKRKKHIRL